MAVQISLNFGRCSLNQNYGKQDKQNKTKNPKQFKKTKSLSDLKGQVNKTPSVLGLAMMERKESFVSTHFIFYVFCSCSYNNLLEQSKRQEKTLNALIILNHQPRDKISCISRSILKMKVYSEYKFQNIVLEITKKISVSCFRHYKTRHECLIDTKTGSSTGSAPELMLNRQCHFACEEGRQLIERIPPGYFVSLIQFSLLS